MAYPRVVPALILLALLSVAATEARPGERFGKKQLEATLPGKTKEEVRSLLGRPASMDRNPAAHGAGDKDDTGAWSYGSQFSPTNTWPLSWTWSHPWTVVDEGSGGPCWSVSVDFTRGKVSSVTIAACEGKGVQ